MARRGGTWLSVGLLRADTRQWAQEEATAAACVERCGEDDEACVAVQHPEQETKAGE